MMKQFIVFNLEAPLSPDLTMRYLLEYLVGSGVKLLVNKCRAEPITPQAAVTVNWLWAHHLAAPYWATLE